MDSEEDSLAASDAELDSEVEDTDTEGELGVWLDQLNTMQKDENSGCNRISRQRLTITPKQVMDSFRCSVLEGGGSQDVDLDAILGELCELESQLTTQQTELDDSLQKSGLNESLSPKPPASPAKPAPVDISRKKPIKTPDPPGVVTSWDDSLDNIDLQLQSALSELSDIVGSSVGNVDFTEAADGTNVASPSCTSASTNKINGNHVISPRASGAPSGARTAPRPLPKTPPKPPVKDRTHLKSNGSSSTLPSSFDNTRHINEQKVTSPTDIIDVDSAFLDNGSLPSSGSHASMATSSSQSDRSSQASGSSGGTSSIPSSAEHSAKLQEEKLKIAMEKIKEANIKKLFLRVFSADGSSKSVLVDEKMTVARVCDMLVAKNHQQPKLTWALVEECPDIYMERMLEDHEFLVENVLFWTRDSTNRLAFVERPDKYDVFIHPEIYLLPDSAGQENEMSHAGRLSLIQEYFSDNTTRIPEVEGVLYLKAEGKKAWKKFYFVLRASGLYYNSKGKSKSKDIICLQKLDFAELYMGVGWKRKYKAPTDYCFALKHPQIQKKASKYIKYFCAEDSRTLMQWTTGIRIVKNERQLLDNYESSRNAIATWGDKEELPNQNFAEYLAKQNNLNRQTVEGHSIDSGYKRLSQSSSSHQRSSFGTDSLDGASEGSIGLISSRCESLDDRSEVSHYSSGTYRSDSYESKNDHDETVPQKMVPVLPVTTSTTKQLSEQQLPHGLIRRPSKASATRMKRTSDTNLPPPPPDPNHYIDLPSPVAADFPPPPPEQMLNSVHTAANGRVKRSIFASESRSPTSPTSLTSPGFAHFRTQSLGSDSSNRSSRMSNESLTQSCSANQSPLRSPPPVEELGHRRASSGPMPVKGRQGPPPPPIKPKPAPPPVPRRSENTKLSFHADNPEAENFITDLQRVLEQKQTRVGRTNPASPPLPPKPQRISNPVMNSAGLPPPPAELLAGVRMVPKKKPPPPPPKRKRETQLSSASSN